MGIKCSIADFEFTIEYPSDWILLTENIEGFNNSCNKISKQQITLRFHQYNREIILGDSIFLADNRSELFLQNTWSVHKVGTEIYYLITYTNHPTIKNIVFTVDKKTNSVDIFVEPKSQNQTLAINPFQHPLGVLTLARLQQIYGGLLIHASGIRDGQNGYIFTGVSGIGKSTMAGIWESIGAEIVNDDRLMISENQNGFSFYNTPMPHYEDFYKSGNLKGIFLLSQSPTNHCTKISGIQALSKVMANFMQQFFDGEIVAEHLNKTERLISTIPVFQLGFKPDTDVVALVRSLNL